MTILVLQTLILLTLVLVLGCGVVVWWHRITALNIFLLLGLSFAVGTALLTGCSVVLLLIGQFDLVVPATWVLAGLGLASLTLAWRELPRFSKRDVVLLLLVAIFTVPVMVHAVRTPLASWDAKVIWLTKAKALYLEPSVPNTLFSSDVFVPTHTDYPIGLPMLTATHYAWYGGVSEQPVALTYVAFFIAILLVLLGGLKQFVPGRSFTASVLLLLTMLAGNVFAYAGLGLADVPLALFFTGASLALCVAVSVTTRTQRNAWMLYGLFFALSAALFKNEAYPFVIFYLGLAGWLLYRERSNVLDEHKGKQKKPERSEYWHWLVAGALCLAGVVPVVLWQLRVSALGLKNDLTSNFVLHGVSFYLERAVIIAGWFGRELTSFDHWGVALLPALLFTVAGVAWHLRAKPHNWRVLAPLALLVAQIAGYVVIYLVSPHDIVWHLSTSLDRLLIQVVPAFYLVTIFIWAPLLKHTPDRV